MKVYWRIGELADELGVYPSTLRYWEKRFGKLHQKISGRTGRLYNERNKKKVLLIHNLLKGEGYTIKGAIRKLKQNRL